MMEFMYNEIRFCSNSLILGKIAWKCRENVEALPTACFSLLLLLDVSSTGAIFHLFRELLLGCAFKY
jgi:hypothetical protein